MVSVVSDAATQLGTSVQAADVYFDRTKSGEKVVVRVREKFQVSRCFDVESQPSAFQCPLRWSHCLEALLTSKEHGSVSNTSNVRSIQLHAFLFGWVWGPCHLTHIPAIKFMKRRCWSLLKCWRLWNSVSARHLPDGLSESTKFLLRKRKNFLKMKI